MEEELQAKVSRLLEDAEQSAQQGKREKAYQSSLKATSLDPRQPMAWYLRSQTAPSLEERLVCLSRAYSLDTTFSAAKNELRSAVQTLLKEEPFLAYVHETEGFYQVRSGRDLLINIPKNRVFETPYLKKVPGLARPAFRWLSASLIALFFGGVGAVLLAPLAAFHAIRLQSLARSRSDRIRLWVIFILSVMIWLASIPISWLLLIRFYS